MAGSEKRYFQIFSPITAACDYKLLSKAVVDIFERPSFSREQSYQTANGIKLKPRLLSIHLYSSQSRSFILYCWCRGLKDVILSQMTAGGYYTFLSKAVVGIYERPSFSQEQSYQPANGLKLKPSPWQYICIPARATHSFYTVDGQGWKTAFWAR